MKPIAKQSETAPESGSDKHIDFEAIENNVPDPADAPAVGELAADDPNSEQKEKTFDILLNNRNYLVKVTPFEFNQDVRYYVTVDDGPTNLFLWDTGMKQIRSLDDTASGFPEGLEKAISGKLMAAEQRHLL